MGDQDTINDFAHASEKQVKILKTIRSLQEQIADMETRIKELEQIQDREYTYRLEQNEK